MATHAASLLIQHIRKLVEPETARLSDRELLARFIAERDEAGSARRAPWATGLARVPARAAA
jgi:hypothetical protein